MNQDRQGPKPKANPSPSKDNTHRALSFSLGDVLALIGVATALTYGEFRLRALEEGGYKKEWLQSMHEYAKHTLDRTTSGHYDLVGGTGGGSIEFNTPPDSDVYIHISGLQLPGQYLLFASHEHRIRREDVDVSTHSANHEHNLWVENLGGDDFLEVSEGTDATERRLRNKHVQASSLSHSHTASGTTAATGMSSELAVASFPSNTHGKVSELLLNATDLLPRLNARESRQATEDDQRIPEGSIEVGGLCSARVTNRLQFDVEAGTCARVAYTIRIVPRAAQ